MTFGRFELLGRLGQGGMGVVFRAHDPKLNRDVALKLLTLPSKEAEAAMLHEARCLAKLSHPNVVALYDTGKVGTELFLTMEFVAGVDVRSLISGFSAPTWQQSVKILVAAGRGLAAAHAAGLEHGDFKPENILISYEGRVQVADFGVARALRDGTGDCDDVGVGPAGGDGSPLEHEQSGGLGSLEYMAPERLVRHRGDARSDQFSFCVALWECVHGERPFAGETKIDLMRAMANRELRRGERGRKVPRRLRKVIARGLSMFPRDRWPDMESLLRALEGIREADKQRPRRRRMAMVGLGLALACSMATAAILPVPEHRVTQTVGVAELTGRAGAYGVDARATMAGQITIVAARGGYVEAALRSLESTPRAEISDKASRRLGLASGAVAAEFERRRIYQDALYARLLAVFFARDAGDPALERQAQINFDAVANAIYTNSAL
ncbi:serine/threonine protein kinase [Enhygromyxa salina]|uniref:Serine/threonine-protein kinase PK-1 n=1 Tax=Enhygromyxa salina TaxID=215803 RepID=A0A2S9YQV9_9BACT|nr:serine/threonine-protein kinase [Enhygromyxa salina]PRQ07473.1 Serine/threonine-protein kinase PK-1 [Enhygromyxa salina]